MYIIEHKLLFCLLTKIFFQTTLLYIFFQLEEIREIKTILKKKKGVLCLISYFRFISVVILFSDYVYSAYEILTVLRSACKFTWSNVFNIVF